MMDKFPDELLLKVLTWIDIQMKLKLSAVNQQWRRVCIDLLRDQKVLDLQRVEGKHPRSLKQNCHCAEDLQRHDIRPKDVIRVNKSTNLKELFASLTKYCPGIIVISISRSEWIRNREDMVKVIDFCVTSYGQHLECFSCGDFSFNPSRPLPVLQHLNVCGISPNAWQSLLQDCKFIVSLQFYELPDEYIRQLPHGLRTFKLSADNWRVEDVFTSAASETLQVVSLRKNDGLDVGNFNLPSLRSFSFRGNRPIREAVMKDLLKSLKRSSHLEELHLYTEVAVGANVDSEWCDFFSGARELKRLRVHLQGNVIGDKVFASVAANCPQLRHLFFGNGVPSEDSLKMLSKLEH